MRVRLFQKRQDGIFFRAIWRPGRGEDQKPLGTRDKAEALRLGRLLLAELLKGDPSAVQSEPLTLGELWRRFSRDCAEFLDNKERSRKGAEASIRVILGYFGGGCLVESLNKDKQRAYAAQMQALETGRSGTAVAWKNPDSGRYGSIVPGPAYQNSGRNCRSYTHTIYVDGRPETSRGTACRNPDGTWTPLA